MIAISRTVEFFVLSANFFHPLESARAGGCGPSEIGAWAFNLIAPRKSVKKQRKAKKSKEPRFMFHKILE
jgi:hypothetical protein